MIAKIPIQGGAYKNIDEASLSQVGPMLIDGYVDELGNTNKRPGLSQFVDLGLSSAVEGLYWWDYNQSVIAVCHGNIYEIKYKDGITATTNITGSKKLLSNARPTFASAGATVAMANGGRIQTYTGSGLTTEIQDADAPTLVTHVAYLDQYILSNIVGTGRFGWSSYNPATSAWDPTYWEALSFASAMSRPDNLLALFVGWREILLVGSESIERWYNDGTTPFSRYSDGSIEGGSSAVDTVRLVDNTWVYLDHSRRLVRLEGNFPKVVSTPFDKMIQEFSRVDDARSDVIEVDGKTFYVMHFPTPDKTLVWNYALNDWSEWAYYNTVSGDYERWVGNCHCYAKAWGFHLVGDRRTGKIYKMSSAYYDDAGEVIRTARRTGHVTQGTMKWKLSKAISVRMKRGQGNDTVTDPKLMVRWRNENSNNWSLERQMSLGKIGETEFIAYLNRLGRYRARQYEFSHTDQTELVLVEAEEELEVLR